MTIYSDRAVYKGVKGVAVKIRWEEGGKTYRDPDRIKLYVEKEDADTHLDGKRFFKYVAIKDLEEYYTSSYSGYYLGYRFAILAAMEDSKEVKLNTGDEHGEREKEFKKIGIEGSPMDREGMIYQTIVKLDLIDKITRSRYSYLTKQKQKQLISAEEFWAEIREARVFHQ